MKTCTGCEQDFPATREYFYADKRASDGLYVCCKTCFLQRAKKSREKDIEKSRAVALASYYRHHEERLESHRRYVASNLEKERARHKRYYQENKEKIKKYQRENLHIWRRNTANYKSRNPEHWRMLKRISAHNRRLRIKTNGGTYSPEDVALQYDSQKGLCWWCEKPLNRDYHIDHRIALARGGSNGAKNIVCACADCNFSKSDKLPHEWIGRLL